MADGKVQNLHPPASAGVRANDGSINGHGSIEEVINGVPQGQPYKSFITPRDVDQTRIPLMVGQTVTFEEDAQGRVSDVKGTGLSCSLWGDPSTVRAGETFTLFWKTQDAVTTVIDQGVGQVQPEAEGSVDVVAGDADTTYTLTASTMADEVTCSFTLQVI